MSTILSNNKFQFLINSIQKLKNQINQESWHRQNQLEILQVKVSYLENDVLTHIQNSNNENQIMIQEVVNKFSEQSRNDLKLLKEKTIQNEESILIGLRNELNQLQNLKNHQQRSILNVYKTKEAYLQKQADLLLLLVRQKSKEFSQEMTNIYELLRIQSENVNNLMQQTLKSSQQINQNYDSIFDKVEAIHHNVMEKISSLRALRNQKKSNFLRLLETIIIKLKQNVKETINKKTNPHRYE